MGHRVLEVIACTVADAVAARNGGAGRLELVRNLEQGGLTPSFELVREIRDKVDLPLRVMVRESIGYEAQSEHEIRQLCVAAEVFDSFGVDGLVIGYLKDGDVDVALCERIVRYAPNSKVTFHHAFEDTTDRLKALRQIKCLPGVDRILCSGGLDQLSERVNRLDEYERLGRPEITVIAGGGIDINAIMEIGRETSIREFHVGRAVRNPPGANGLVKAELVSNLVGVLREL